MTLTYNERAILVKLSLDNSQTKYEACAGVMDSHPDLAVSAAYYSVFHSAKALLIEYEVEIQKRIRGHRGLNSLFYENFVKKGLFPENIAKCLGRLEQKRNLSDYEPKAAFSKEELQDIKKDVSLFNAAVRKLIAEHQLNFK